VGVAVRGVQRFTAVMRSALTGWWLGQSGFVLGTAGAAIAIDPFLTPDPRRRFAVPAAPEDLAGLDAILVTHEHRDHLDLPTLLALVGVDPRVKIVVPKAIVDGVVREGLPVRSVIGVGPGDELAFGTRKAIRVWPLPSRHAVHFPPVKYDFGLIEGGGQYRFLGYVVDVDGVRIYHSGDSIDYDGLAETLRDRAVDAVFLPINGRDAEREAQDLVGNFTEAEAVDLARRSAARWAVPMHYEMYPHNPGDPGRFVTLLRETAPQVGCLLPAHGEPFVIGRTPLQGGSGELTESAAARRGI